MQQQFNAVTIEKMTKVDHKLNGAIALLTFVAVGLMSFLSFVGVSHAGPGNHFGGQITIAYDCMICTSDYADAFNDLAVTSMTNGLPLIYYPGRTTVYDYMPPTMSGQWMLGLWEDQSDICEIYVYEECVEIDTAGTMTHVGASY